MRDSEIQQAKMAVWILGGVEDRGEERPWFRIPNADHERGGKTEDDGRPLTVEVDRSKHL